MRIKQPEQRIFKKIIDNRYVPRSRVGQLIANGKRKLKLLYATPGELPPENDGALAHQLIFQCVRGSKKSIRRGKSSSHHISF